MALNSASQSRALWEVLRTVTGIDGKLSAAESEPVFSAIIGDVAVNRTPEYYLYRLFHNPGEKSIFWTSRLFRIRTNGYMVARKVVPTSGQQSPVDHEVVPDDRHGHLVTDVGQ